MFGLGRDKKHLTDDNHLPLLVEVIQNAAVFALAQKVWSANARAVRQEPANHKEFLHFGALDAPQAVWLERDAGRADAFELVLTWWQDGARFADIYTITPESVNGPSGDAHYAGQVLDALLTTPATLPASQESQAGRPS